MFQGNFVQLMAAYNQWQNQAVYQAAMALSDAQRKEDRGAFFKSVHGTLNHILWGDLWWFGRFSGSAVPTTAAGVDLYEDFAALLQARQKLDQDILDWAATLAPEWLNESVTWTSKLYGFTQTVPRWVQVQHFFNHQTHHRGQAGTLLKQFGQDVGITDIPMLPLLHND
jgi:uncharacterized damage-inducible protein DinB